VHQRDYIGNDQVRAFSTWLVERLRGEPIDFSVADYRYNTLQDALTHYRWPLRIQRGLPNQHAGLPYIHPDVPVLVAGSNLAANTQVLNIIQQQLVAAYNASPGQSDHLSGAVAAVFHWGGVYTERGNRGWLREEHARLHEILQRAVQDHARNEDDSGVADLRFNSGMTKVYSLLIPDFIIYDSRVAASLAWLTQRWWLGKGEMRLGDLPDVLKFGCFLANGNMAKNRNPDSSVFPTLSNQPRMHYKWNIRANWLLRFALNKAGNLDSFKSLRDVEAALFQMGYRVI
jgi:hypothetical protein